MEWKVEQPWKGELINDFPAGASLGMEKEVMVAPALSCRLGRGYAFRILLPGADHGFLFYSSSWITKVCSRLQSPINVMKDSLRKVITY